MKRGGAIARRTPISRARLRQVIDPGKSLAYAAAREAVFARCGGWCEGCSARLTLSSMHAHHRLPRSAGRNDSPANLVAFDQRCHSEAHAGPQRAIRNGWIISRHDHRAPSMIPVLLPAGWFLLADDGTRVHLPGWTPTE